MERASNRRDCISRSPKNDNNITWEADVSISKQKFSLINESLNNQQYQKHHKTHHKHHYSLHKAHNIQNIPNNYLSKKARHRPISRLSFRIMNCSQNYIITCALFVFTLFFSLFLPNICLANQLKRDLYNSPWSSSNNNGRLPLFSTKRSGTNLCARVGGIGPLGMESGAIADNALSASSSFEKLHVGPQNARLNRDIAGGAWCPHQQIGPDSEEPEWIQIDLGPHRHVITGVATQGRHGKGYGLEYSDHYELTYSRQDTPTHWIKWIGYNRRTVLDGNSDPNTVFENELEGPIVGVRYIRLLPVSNHTRTVCFRLELYGCLHNGPLSYTVVPVSLVDTSYDGGLGKLTDGIFAIEAEPISEDFETDPVWVEWASTSGRIEIRYDFEQIQNFTSLNINTMADQRGVSVLKEVFVSFSLDSNSWHRTPVEFIVDSSSPSPFKKNLVRDISIDLHGRIGRHVRLELRHIGDKLRISETHFDSFPLDVNWTGVQLTELFERSNSQKSPNQRVQHNVHQAQQEHQDGQQSQIAFGSHRTTSSRQFTPTIILLLVAFFAVIGATAVGLALAYRRHIHQRRNGRHVYAGGKSTSLTGFLSTGSDLSAVARCNKSHETLSVVSQHLYCDPKEMEAEYAVPDPMTPLGITMTPGVDGGMLAQPNGTSRFYASSDLISSKPNLYTVRPPQSQILNVHDLSRPEPFRTMQQSACQPLTMLERNRKLNAPKSGTLFTPRPQNQLYTALPLELRGIRTFQETEIGVLESLGKSRFGDVLLCKIGQARRPTIVRTTIEPLKQEFLQTVQLWNSISAGSPDKFAQILGVIETPTYFATVQEHSECDLHQFLSGLQPDSLSYESLLQIAAQVASGGVHLETIEQPHRDLAARNVVVVSSRRIRLKLTDAGAFQSSRYGSDYYNGSLPVRWASPETIVAGHFTLAADIHSFGVLLWEILTLCRKRPFEALSDQQLIDRAYTLTEAATLGAQHSVNCAKLEQPGQCTADLYELMIECTHSNPAQRPTFHELYLFLQRKTLNYSSQTHGQNTHSIGAQQSSLTPGAVSALASGQGPNNASHYTTISSAESHDDYEEDDDEDDNRDDTNPYSNL